jgi:O-antigen/teichoic acid export membrane protein
VTDESVAVATPGAAAAQSLRTRVLRGAVFLFLRQGLGTVLSLGAVLLIVRAIGPVEYGLAAAAMGIYTYFLEVLPLGIGTYLVRHDGELSREDRDQAFTCLLVSGVGGLAIALAAVPLLQLAIGVPGFWPIAVGLLTVIPLSVIATFPLALLERDLDFRRIAMIELCSQVCCYASALALAYQGSGAFALVAGWWIKEAVSLTLLLLGTRHRPGILLERARARRILRYGMAYSLSGWVWQLRYVLTPVLVGRLAGAEVLGVVLLTTRFVQNLNFVAAAVRRLSLSALARLQGDVEKLSRVCSEAMVIQVLALGPFVVLFAVAAPILSPRLLGPHWGGIALLFPFLALSALVDSAFSFHSQVLHVLDRSLDVAAFNAVRLVLFATGCLVFLPRFGLVGYGYAEVLSFISYGFVHWFAARRGLRVRYALPMAFQAVFAVALFYNELGWAAALAPLVIIAWPGSWRLGAQYARSFRGQSLAQ